MRRNTYTSNEIILCAYAALYDVHEFGGAEAIHNLTGRSLSSIKMKIGNMAAMLDEEGIVRNPRVSPLLGTPPGQGVRRTDWEEVKVIVTMPKPQLQSLCRRIFEAKAVPGAD